MRASRLPVLLLVVGAVVAAGLAVRADDDATSSAPPAPDVREIAPIATGPDALGSTWYCAAGSAGDPEEWVVPEETAGEDEAAQDEATEGEPAEDDTVDAEEPAEGEPEDPEALDPEAEPTGPVRLDHSVTISNAGDEDRTAVVSIHAGREEPVVVDIEIPALTSERIDLADHAVGPAVAALVEVDGGDVVVHHHLVGETGIDSGPCSASSSDVWHFAWGDTSRDMDEVIAIFNPFPGDAVVDFTFSTSEGSREPRGLTGLVVPRHSVVVADVSAEVTRRSQVSTTLTTRSGRVIAERVQVADGSQREDEALRTREGLAVDLGTSVPSELWVHPYVQFSPDIHEDVVVYNPSDEPAEVDVEINLGPDVVGGVEPFELTLRPRGFEVVRLDAEPRLMDLFGEDSGRFTATIRSVNGVPVVAEIVTTLRNPGLAAATGGAVVGTSTIVAAPFEGEPAAGALALLSLDADGPTTVEIVAIDGGERDVLDEVELEPGERLEIDFEDEDLDGVGALIVESSSPIAVEWMARWVEPFGYDIRAGVVRLAGAIPTIDALG